MNRWWSFNNDITIVLWLLRWQATLYPRFADMDLTAAKRMLGSYGAWPKDEPPKMVETAMAEDIPVEFDSRQKWPGSIHEIRNQVGLLDVTGKGGVEVMGRGGWGAWRGGERGGGGGGSSTPPYWPDADHQVLVVLGAPSDVEKLWLIASFCASRVAVEVAGHLVHLVNICHASGVQPPQFHWDYPGFPSKSQAPT